MVCEVRLHWKRLIIQTTCEVCSPNRQNVSFGWKADVSETS